MAIMKQQLRSYIFLAFLLLSILLGSAAGLIMGEKAAVLKPLGDIFLNLLFTVVIPLIFFSVASAISSMGEMKRIAKVLGMMMATFLFTSIIAALFMLFVVTLFPPAQGVNIQLSTPVTLQNISIGEQITRILTVPDFYKLFSRENILALIFFAALFGLATASLGEKGKIIDTVLRAGTDVSMKLVSFVMYYAPVGFFAYFAVLVGQLGQEILTSYIRVTVIYYAAASIYLIVAYSFFAYLAGRKQGVTVFWKNSPLPMITALATCSSAASIPANLQAVKRMGVPAEIYETVIPLGTVLHKEGSVLGGIIKIAFLFGIFNMDFSGLSVMLIALMISLLVGTVMGAIPSGGLIAEMLILSLYGLPPQALIIIAAITFIIDPPATLLNVMGNTVCSLLVARLIEGKKWLKYPRAKSMQF